MSTHLQDEIQAPPAAEVDDNVFRTLARQARTSSRGELWTTAIGAGINASLLLLQHPGLSWLAGAFAAVSAYGFWGVADLAAQDARFDLFAKPGRIAQLIGLRDLAAGAGVIAALWSVFSFMAAALGNWNH